MVDAVARAKLGLAVGQSFCDNVLTPEFFEKHWEKFPLHRRAADHEGNVVNLLPHALSPDDIVQIIRGSGSYLKIFRRGDPYDMDHFRTAYLDGASLIVNQADRSSKTLFDLCSVLAKRHFYHVFSVMYLTPPDSQAVRLHNDDQDVFLLQVWGSKKWTIRNAPKLLPYTEEMLGKDSVVPPELVKEPVMEFTMEPHDILYIPRGYLHEAMTVDGEPSLHVTITIPTSDFCWGVQLVKHMMKQVQRSELPPQMQTVCNSSLSERGLSGRQTMDDATLDARLQELLEAWKKDLSVESVVDAFEQRMAATNQSQQQMFKRREEIQLRPCVTEDSRVRLMCGIQRVDETIDAQVVFSRSSDGKKLVLDMNPSAVPLIKGLTSKPQHVRDLPCADKFERLCVLQVLLE